MVKIYLSHLCDYAAILHDGKPAIIGIFDEIISKSKPIVRNFSIIFSIIPQDTNSHKTGIKIKSPSGKEVGKPLEGNLGPASRKDKKIGMIINVERLKLEEEGEYTIEISIDGEVVETLPLRLIIQD